MLEKAAVEEEEEALRLAVNQLSDEQRAAFYKIVKSKIKDPDTYAALNWFFVCGLHHFYLGKWLQGATDLAVFLVGVVLVILGYTLIGLVVIGIMTVIECWALFRSQLIIQDWNNQVYKKELKYLMETGD